MKFKIALTLAIFVSLSALANAQSANSKFSQFIITNVDTREKMLEIDDFMRAQQGIEISRADIVSKKYLCIYNPSSPINKELLEKWMTDLGVEIKCYREGKFGTDKIIDQKMDCE